ncbi:MAG: DUF512 domain-containing protein [Clostridia bacterium]|nr:DUF512 domain-containing protein [Clostridia bacterium]
MSVEIKSVKKWSQLFFKGVKSGDKLLSINENEINDFLDYQFYLKDEKVILEIEHDGKIKRIKLHKKAEDDIGLEFETYLMDNQKRCHNKCIFCFIDQNPKGMRETIYFKDDDSRLSFLFGNYITLTNLTDKDIDRIIKMHISPVNISVHTMNKELRVKMMHNKRAGECLDMVKRLADAGIELNTQLVLCPGINDGKELLFSLTELGKLYPAVQSIAAVPVGITKHREGLFDMPGYNKETAADVIDIISRFGDEFKEKHGTRLAYAADEFYLKAEREIPDADYYEGYPQIENGVGMWTSLRDEVDGFLKDIDPQAEVDRKLSIATGVAAYPLIKGIADELMKVYPKLKVNVYEIKNDFFGHTITVAGLITAQDLINQLRDKQLHGLLLIPEVMLMSDGSLFLDNYSLDDVEKALDVSIDTVASDGVDLVNKIIG